MGIHRNANEPGQAVLECRAREASALCPNSPHRHDFLFISGYFQLRTGEKDKRLFA
jgi:hypothetical protein